MARSLPIDLVSGDINAHIVNKKKWDECLDVSKSLYKTLILDNTRDFVVWDTHLMSVLHRTQSIQKQLRMTTWNWKYGGKLCYKHLWLCGMIPMYLTIACDSPIFEVHVVEMKSDCMIHSA